MAVKKPIGIEISGPTTGVDNTIPKFVNGKGNLVEASGVKIDDDNKMDIPGGVGEVQVDHVEFNTSYSGSHAEGILHWNPDEGCLEIGMPGGNVVAQLSMETLLPKRVKNNSGVDIKNGDAVYTTTGFANTAEVELSRADDFTTSLVSGLATEDIDDKAYGWVTVFGIVRGDETQPINTSSYDTGEFLYLSATEAGKWTNVIPDAPNNKMFIGRVWRSHSTEGEIFVLPIATQHVARASDVYNAPNVDLTTLMWNEAEGYYENNKVVYEDLQVSISNIRIPAANAPTERLYDGGTGGVTFPFLGFAVGNYIYFDVQTRHGMKLNTILDQHVHFTLPNTTDIGDKFQWQLDVMVAPIGSEWAEPSGTPFTSEHTVAAGDNTYHRLMELADIPAVNTTVSTIYKCKLTRIAASSDEYASEVYLTFADGHYQKDTMGSRSENSK